MQRIMTRTTITSALFALVLALPAVAPASGDHEGGHGNQAQKEENRNNKDHHGDGDGHSDGHGDGHGHDGGHSVAFGEPANAAEANRTIEIIARDTMEFEPARIEVEAGETVRFVVKNVGQLQHSFTLGTPASQREHEKEMQGMAMEKMAGHMNQDPTGMVIQPGDSGTLTWRFAKAGRVQFACHIPGHYPAGMKGRISVDR